MWCLSPSIRSLNLVGAFNPYLLMQTKRAHTQKWRNMQWDVRFFSSMQPHTAQFSSAWPLSLNLVGAFGWLMPCSSAIQSVSSVGLTSHFCPPTMTRWESVQAMVCCRMRTDTCVYVFAQGLVFENKHEHVICICIWATRCLICLCYDLPICL